VNCNERPADRIVRAVVGAILLALAFFMIDTPIALVEGTIALAVGIAGGISFLTGVMGWCPFYAALGYSSCAAEAPPASSQARQTSHAAAQAPRHARTRH
jgi:hypothetical protein